MARPAIDSFTQSWNKTVNWAKQNNIPYQAYYPVYQLDSQRLLSGNPLTESERVRAIQAAAGLNYSTALPTDTPDWANVRSNAVTNAEDIFTGLEPTHIIPNIIDTVKSTLTHPGDIFSAIGDLFTGNTQAAAKQVLKQNNILQWVPGALDLAKLYEGQPGLPGAKAFESLAQDPITSLLDIVPFGRLTSETLGRTTLGDAAAGRLGITNAELRKAGIWRIGGKLIKSTPIPSILSKADHPYLVNGEITTQLTIGQRWEYAKQKIGASSEQADIGEERLKGNSEGTKLVEQYVSPLFAALSRLNPDERNALNKWARTDFRPLAEKMADSNIPLKIREAYAEADAWGKEFDQLQMQAGDAKTFQTPFKDDQGNPVTETYHVNTDQYKTVSRAMDQSQRDQTTLDNVAKPFDTLLYKIDENDSNVLGAFQVLDQQRNAIYESIKRSIPQEDAASVTDRLRSTLPQGERWDRAVSEQTPVIRNILGLLPSDRLSLHQVNALRDLFSPGGLLDQMKKAYDSEDWVGLNKVSKAAVRKFRTKSLSNIPKDGRAVLHTTYRITENLQKYSVLRQRMTKELGRRAPEIARYTNKAAKSHQAWLKAAIHNPPDVWRNVGIDALTAKLGQAEKTAAAMEDTTKVLSAQGWTESELTKIRQDPRTILELMTNSAKGTLENNMLPDIDHAEFNQVTEDMYNELASLRARGESPLYIPMVTPYDIDHGLDPTYDVHLSGVKPRKPSASFQRVWGYTPSIYDIGAGVLKATKEMVEKDMLNHFVQQELIPRLQDASDIQALLANYYKTEIADLADQTAKGGPRSETALSIINRGLDKLNLVAFDPGQFFGEGFSHPSLSKPYYINKDIAAAFKQTIDKFQFPAQRIVDRGTQLFRFSILGLSPRYTAHILFGGTFLVALRGTPGMLKFLPQAVHFAVHNSFDERTLQRFPYITELEGGISTQEGAAVAQYHYAAMNSAGRNWLIPEWLNRHLLNDTYKNRIRAAGDLNIRFTRAITRAQKGIVYLYAAAKASRDGSMYYADELVPRTPSSEGSNVDAQGRPIMHPITGRRIHDTVRSEVPMTPRQAHQQGIEAVADVMGNLRHMTPLERNLLVRVFPFYGWTKHILQYVMSYPFDHPWRAMILGNLAMQNSEDVASGLPLRIQLLTFLGQPDQFGNVTAIDTKALDPLRDTANYASLAGLFESLNPAITAVGALVDPQFSFGGQNLYPQITFNKLYGVKTAGAGGKVFNAAEQFVPQLTSLDEAFNLSGQYAYLANAAPGAFSKKVFESLGLPFTPEQLNLRQMAAQEEIDRYQIAASDAANAAKTGDLSTIEQYPANAQLPDPLNTLYNVTPAYIAAMTQESEDQYGLPYYETATPPPNPAL